MRIEAACFTSQGCEVGQRLQAGLRAHGDAVGVTRCGEGGVSLRQWTAEHFGSADALVFIGAAGIAVRAVAPLLVSKLGDPAVVAVDDCGRFAVPLLSGHIGGANALARRVASLLDAVPVITTATDANGVFAVDEWAARKGLAILNPENIRRVSATLLGGAPVSLRSDFPVVGDLPEGVTTTENPKCDIRISVHGPCAPETLILVPPAAVLGIGCRKNTPAERIESAFTAFCTATGIYPQAFGRVHSIDLKRDEPGLRAFCENRSLIFETFAAEQLAAVEGATAGSEFVLSVTGVDNVCERSALAAGGSLAARRTIIDGIALAAAIHEYRVDFTLDGATP